jgi:hypothetical protein
LSQNRMTTFISNNDWPHRRPVSSFLGRPATLLSKSLKLRSVRDARLTRRAFAG